MLKNVASWLRHSNIGDFTSHDPKKRNYRLLVNRTGVICKDHVVNMVAVEPPSDGFTNHNLTQSDLDVSGFRAMHVQPAYHVVHRRVSAALQSWDDASTRPRAHAASRHANEGHMGGTVEFLEVFADLFHEFFLKTDLRLYDMDAPQWQFLDRAEQYMRDWASWIETTAMGVWPDDADERRAFKAKGFLSWQSVRCIMLTLEGYRGYVRDWFAHHPGAYKPPALSSQSPLESYFGHVRRSEGDARQGSAAAYHGVYHRWTHFDKDGSHILRLQPHLRVKD